MNRVLGMLGLLATGGWIGAATAQVPSFQIQTAPSVSLVSPAPNAVISEAYTPTVWLEAMVTTADAPIAQVTFSYCPSVGTSCTQSASTAVTMTTPPYVFAWTPPHTVSQTTVTLNFAVWATAINANGEARNSAVAAITVIQPPPPPSIALIAPRNDSGFVTPASPVLYATASPGSTNPPSTLVAVDFLDGEDIIGTVTTPNADPSGYAMAWANAPQGIHLVTARVTDSLGYSALSTPIVVYVIGPDPPPLVSLDRPATGQVFVPASTIPLAAFASSPLGTIQRVEFLAADRVVATSFASPFAANWVDPPPGNFAIVAKAYDDIGVAAASAAAYVTVLPGPRTPVVVVTAPVAGSSMASGTPFDIVAEAVAPDSNLSRVDFYAGQALVGSASSAPYKVSWSNPPAGSQSLSAKAVDVLGNVGVSAAVPVMIANNRPPTAFLTSPANGASFTAPATIELTATANDPDGAVAKVDFFAGATKVGTATVPPFVVSWSGVAPGTYALTAVATDNLGASSTSSAVNVSVTNPSVRVALTMPVEGAVFGIGETITLAAHADAPQRGLSRVEFYADGSMLGSVAVEAGSMPANVTFLWSGAPGGSHQLSAKTVALDGAAASSSSVSIVVLDLGVNLAEPQQSQSYVAGARIRIVASTTGATAASRVDFLVDGRSVGGSASPPYVAYWDAIQGAHQVSARAYDAAGHSVDSASVSISVSAPNTADLNIVSPTISQGASAAVQGDFVLVHGTYVGPQNTGITIDGYVAETDGIGHFALNGVPLDEGTNSIDVVLTSIDGQTLTKTIPISRSGIAPYQIVVAPHAGFAPFSTILTAISRGSGPVTRVDVTNLGGGTFDATTFDGQVLGTLAFSTPGMYFPEVTVQYGAQQSYTQTVAVAVKDAAAMDRMFTGMFSQVATLLRNHQAASALSFLTEPIRPAFQAVFNQIDASLPQIVDTFAAIGGIDIGNEMSTYVLKRRAGDDIKIFMIDYIRDVDGVWRIDSW